MFEFTNNFDRSAAPDNWEFGLSGFRSFHELREFEFSQVSFITGGNHTGKSTILRALSVLLDTLKAGGFILTLDGRNGLMHQIPSLDQLVPWGVGGDEEHEIKLSIKIGNINLELSFQRMSQVNEAWLKGVTIFFSDGKKPVKLLSLSWVKTKKPKSFVHRDRIKWQLEVHKWVFDDSGSFEVGAWERFVFLLNYHEKDGKRSKELKNWFSDFDTNGRKKAGNYMSTRVDGVSSFSGLRNRLTMSLINSESRGDNELIDPQGFKFLIVSQILESFISSLPVMRHLGSQRDVAPRVATVGTSPYRIFAEVSQQRVHGLFEKGDDFMRRWMTKLNIGENFDIRQVSGLGYAVRVQKVSRQRSDGNWCSLADLSMGEAQIFRILLTLAQAINEIGDSNKWVICVLEEPDSNLHPSTQSALLDALVAAANHSRLLQIFMETHSEVFVRSLQLKVKEKELRKEAVVINYLEDENVSNAENRRIKLDANGRTSVDFGTGFIDESGELAIRLL